MTCPNCGHEVPAAPFCVRCGTPLENESSPYPLEGRAYAAAPHEHWFVPKVISSIFPHLPKSAMHGFRAALLAGIGAIVVLCLFRLFPLALICAAVLVPFLTILYFWDVDLYEDEPVPALLFTILWGAAAGVGVGLLARHLASPVTLVPGQVTTHEVIWLGLLVPLFSAALMMVGPLVLLPYHRFNDVLDGATFGGACAVTLLGAEAITNSAGFLSGGWKVAGNETLWIARLLTLGVALPVAGAGAVGAACGALWLRYRTAPGEREALGLMGSPLLALPIGVSAVVGVNFAEVYLGEWSSLAVALAIAAVSLVALRRVIHFGLCQEAGEMEIGPATRCTNCGRDTPLHSFCAHCGVSLRALPKIVTEDVRLATPRLSHTRRLIAFGVLFAAAAGIAVLVIALVRPSASRPSCSPGLPCANPPQLPGSFSSHLARAALVSPYAPGKTWTGSTGVSVRYDPQLWSATQDSGTALYLKAENNNGDFVLTAVVTVPSSTGPEQLLQKQVSAESGDFLGLERDTSPKNELLGPEIGFVHGIGAMYTATWNKPPSPSERLEFAFEAATFGNATVLVEAVTNEQASGSSDGSSSPFPFLGLVDQVLDSFQWAGT